MGRGVVSWGFHALHECPLNEAEAKKKEAEDALLLALSSMYSACDCMVFFADKRLEDNKCSTRFQTRGYPYIRLPTPNYIGLVIIIVLLSNNSSKANSSNIDNRHSNIMCYV